MNQADNENTLKEFIKSETPEIYGNDMNKVLYWQNSTILMIFTWLGQFYFNFPTN